ncbi:MAG: DUF2034 domain-containing protein [Betaproteobacteria bacterium]|nr:DUF2034 domain-containing protein [Betaproteobacteria bacterium]
MRTFGSTGKAVPILKHGRDRKGNSGRMARRRQSVIEDVLDAAAKLPWWLGVLLAIGTYFVFRWLAVPEPATPGSVRPPSAVVGSSIARALALAGQFLMPLVFLGGAAISAFQGAKRKRVVDLMKREPEWDGESPQPAASEQTLNPGLDLYSEWKEAGLGGYEPEAVDTSRWSLELLKALEWKRFEYVCAGYFEELGFRAKTVRAGPDGGVDIHLYTEGAEHPGIIVQCKAWKSRKVGVNLIRELFGVMSADKVQEGIFATTGTYSSDATQFAIGKNIHLINGEDILTKLQALPPHRQQSLLKFATEGDFMTPTCPSCGIKMAFRAPKAGGNPFWGCRNYPRCKTILQVSKGQ